MIVDVPVVLGDEDKVKIVPGSSGVKMPPRKRESSSSRLSSNLRTS